MTAPALAIESPLSAAGSTLPVDAVLLAIETSGLKGSVAVWRAGQCVEQQQLELGKQHGQVLIPEIHALLNRHALTARKCTHLAVSVGPGSFTGLRVGIVCAKTFAYATGCHLLAVGTLAAVAEGVASEEDVDALVVISDAQRGDLFVQRFQATRGVDDDRSAEQEPRWQPDGPVTIQAVEALKHTLSPRILVAGPGLVLHAALLQGVARLADEAAWHPQARHVARLAELSAVRGDFADPWKLEPLYLRRSSAEDKWDAMGR